MIKLPAKSVGNRELKRNGVSGSKTRPRAISRSDLAPSARAGTRAETDFTTLSTIGFWTD